MKRPYLVMIIGIVLVVVVFVLVLVFKKPASDVVIHNEAGVIIDTNDGVGEYVQDKDLEEAPTKSPQENIVQSEDDRSAVSQEEPYDPLLDIFIDPPYPSQLEAIVPREQLGFVEICSYDDTSYTSVLRARPNTTDAGMSYLDASTYEYITTCYSSSGATEHALCHSEPLECSVIEASEDNIFGLLPWLYFAD